MKTLSLMLIVIFSLVLMAGSTGQTFRGDTYDRDGKLLWRDRGGDRINRDGHVIERRIKRGKDVYVYDRDGRLLRIERYR